MAAAGAPGASTPQRFRDELRWLAFHSSSALVMRGLRSVGSFVFNLVLARLLGAGGSGVYFLALGMTELAAQAARMGMDPTVVRFFAGRETRSLGFYYRAVALVSATGVAATALLIGAAPFICEHLFAEPSLIVPLRIMALGIVPLSLLILHSSLLQSAGQIGTSIFVHFVALFLIGIPFLWLLARDGSLAGASLAYVASIVSVLVLGVALWRTVGVPKLALDDSPVSSQVWRTAVRAGLSFWTIGLLSTVSAHADVFLLGALATMEDVGTYRVAFRVAVLGSAALEAVGVAITPRMAAYHSRGDLRGLERTGRAASSLAVVLTVPYWLLVLGFPQQVLSLFGDDFTAGATALVVLMLGRIVNAVAGPVNGVLAMTGHERPLRNLTVITAVSRIVLLYLAIPLWGLMGVAVVCCLTDIANNAASTVLVRRRLGICVLPLPGRILPLHRGHALSG